MNDPTTTDSYDEDMIHDLEQEFAGLGHEEAIDFGLMHSDELCACSRDIMIRLMTIAPDTRTEKRVHWEETLRTASVAMVAREGIANCLEKHVAPKWVKAEFHKRVTEAKLELGRAILEEAQEEAVWK